MSAAQDDESRVPVLVDHLFREHYGRLVAALVKSLGPAHLDLVEDVVQEALARALRLWPYEGVPDEPAAWLARVARNAALDLLRRRRLVESKHAEIARAVGEAADAPELAEGIDDDRLRLVITCCHPAIAFEARVALTLKTVCGFSVREIARAFLAEEATIAQRIVRTKRRIQEARIPFATPSDAEIGERLDAVLEVVYLVFNEGYSAHAGDDVVRTDLVGEAQRLARLLLEHPASAQPRTHALAALFCFQGARIPARADERGEIRTLANQDRALWDRTLLAQGWRHFERSIAGERLTAYHLEAAIASVHAAAPTYADTDWETILARYDEWLRLAPTPVVALNRAVALAKARGLEAGLAELDRIERAGGLGAYHLLPATRGLVLWQLGRVAEASEAFARAWKAAGTEPERRLLQRRLEQCRSGAPAEDF